MDVHKRILAILFIISGSLQALTLILLTTFFSVFLPLVTQNVPPEAEWVFVWLVPFFRVLTFCIILFFALPSIAGGIALLNGKDWALTLLMVLGCFKLFSFPIGTALGIYAIWVYAEDHKRKAPVPATS